MVDTNYNRLLAMVFGWVLLVVGILGFIPGITVNGPGPVTGHSAPPARVIGIFEVNVLHSVVHVLSGVVLLAGAYMMAGANARTYNLVLGVVYVVVFLAGLLVAPIANLVAIDTADNALHLLLGVVLLAVPFVAKDTLKTGGRNVM